jgi:putative PIG3 family NAD(P)H quinone oxidoreductase
VLVKVKAFGLNRMDIMQREGKYPLPAQASKTIMGVEFSGEVVKMNEQGLKSYNGEEWKDGDHVFGLAYGGAYAEYIAISSQMIIRKPESLSWIEAAGIPENWMTAFQALFLEGGFKKGENVLVHAGASGVGVAANQLAVAFGANKVFTTAGTADKVAFLDKLSGGKVHPINYREQNFEEEVRKIDEKGVDVIVDFVGPNYWNKNIALLRQDGRLIILAFLSGATLPDKASFAPLLFKRLTVRGTTLRSRAPEYQGELLGRFEKEALPMIVKGDMKVSVHDVYGWDRVAEAHREMEANKNSGKIVLEIK